MQQEHVVRKVLRKVMKSLPLIRGEALDRLEIDHRVDPGDEVPVFECLRKRLGKIHQVHDCPQAMCRALTATSITGAEWAPVEEVR